MKLSLYDPHPNQILIHESTAKYRVVVAGRRFGKSALALNEALARAFQLKDQIIWIVLPEYKQAKEIYWIDPDVTRYFMPYVQAKLVKKDDTELSLRVHSTNSWIRLKGSDNYESLRGSGIDLLIWDEVADVKPEAFDTIKPSLADSPYHRTLYIGTPKGVNWFHDFALMGDRQQKIPSLGKSITYKKDWETWHFTSYDNLAFPPDTFEGRTFKTYIDEQREELKSQGREDFFNQEYLALFNQSAGQFFKEFDVARHVINPFIPNPNSSLIVGGMDWGRTHAFAFYLSAVTKEVYEEVTFFRSRIFMEVWGFNRNPQEWANIIKEQIGFYGIYLSDIEWIRADPAIWVKQQDNSRSIEDQFKEEKIWVKPASNNRLSGWENLHRWLSIAPDGKPYLQFSSVCKNAIRTIPELVHDENKHEDVDTDGPDDAGDSLRYLHAHLKWIDARVGAVKENRDAHTSFRQQFYAQMEDGGQVAINTNKFR